MKIVKKNKKISKNLYEVSQKLGLDKKEVYNLITDVMSGNEQITIANGPIEYLSTMYGTISVNDFL